MNDAKYIGLDVHQATISMAVLDPSGSLILEAILETKARLRDTRSEQRSAAISDSTVLWNEHVENSGHLQNPKD
jgi:hypothetical protein